MVRKKNSQLEKTSRILKYVLGMEGLRVIANYPKFVFTLCIKSGMCVYRLLSRCMCIFVFCVCLCKCIFSSFVLEDMSLSGYSEVRKIHATLRDSMQSSFNNFNGWRMCNMN